MNNDKLKQEIVNEHERKRHLQNTMITFVASFLTAFINYQPYPRFDSYRYIIVWFVCAIAVIYLRLAIHVANDYIDYLTKKIKWHGVNSTFNIYYRTCSLCH